MILAVDAGNSRTKWGVFDDEGSLRAQGALENAAVEQLVETWRAAGSLRRVVGSCVAGDALKHRLDAMFETLALPAVWVQPQARACGVSNGYQKPEQLGSDRWAALVAAWNQHHTSCVVVTAGTALTVDALSGQGEFLGGLIAPGFGMMRAALMTGTAAVSPPLGALRDFPATTADAVHSGALVAMTGAVERMCTLLAVREGKMPLCLLSGGDAVLLAAVLDRPTMAAPDLVLQGLYLMEKTYS